MRGGVLLALVLLLAPGAAGGQGPDQEEPQEEGEVVAEALFLTDPLPPGGRDLSLSLEVARGERDPVTGQRVLSLAPSLEVAAALGRRLGFTADVGVSGDGERLEAPGASLKLLLRPPAPGVTGLATSFGLHSALEGTAEAGAGLGAIRSFGPLALRAGAHLTTDLSQWSPRLHGGVSAAMALGLRWRVLAEAVAEVQLGRAAVSAGPTFKVALGEEASLMLGALWALSPGAAFPVVSLQLTRAM